MDKRKHYKDELILLHFGDLSPEQTKEVTSHLKACSQCREEQKKLEKMFQFIDQKEYREPPSLFWNHYWRKLRPKLKETKISSWQLFIRKTRLDRYPQWSIAVATSALLLIIGIVYYWFYSTQRIPETIEKPELLISQGTPSSISPAYIQRAASDYLHEVKPVLLEFANVQPTTMGEQIDFSLEREMSRYLLLQNRLLRGAAGDSLDPQLLSLFEDIELVLIDVSNLEENNQEPSIIFIKENMADLPTKIDLFASKLK